MQQLPICVYHKDCTDGTTAAAVFLRKYPGARTFALQHDFTDADMDVILEAARDAEHVFMIDIAIGYRDILNAGFPLTVLDHHIHIRDELEMAAPQDDKLTVVFDNELSGASLAWKYFFPEEEVPTFIEYIEDVDLWRLRHGDDTLAVQAFASMRFNDPDSMQELLEAPIEQLLEEGHHLLDYIHSVQKLLLSKIEPITLRIGEHAVPGYNIIVYQSSLGHQLAEEQGKAVALYTVEGKTVRFSFRSEEGQNPTALELATILGGGGHDGISGAEIPLEHFLSLIEH